MHESLDRTVFVVVLLLLTTLALPAAQVNASATQLTFGPLHVSAAATQSVTLTNLATATAVPVYFSASLSALGHLRLAPRLHLALHWLEVSLDAVYAD